MPFVKGQSGNPGGRSTEKIWRDAILKAVKERSEPGGKQKLELVVDALIASACDGDVVAMREIGDRLDGKAIQALSDPDGGPLQIQIMRFQPESA